MLQSIKIRSSALIIGFAAVSSVGAQTPAAKLSYEVSSTKPNNSGAPSSSGEFGPHLRATNLTLKSLILLSYRIPESQLTGGPDWIGTQRFDIEAKAMEGVQTHEPEENFALIR